MSDKIAVLLKNIKLLAFAQENFKKKTGYFNAGDSLIIQRKLKKLEKEMYDFFLEGKNRDKE